MQDVRVQRSDTGLTTAEESDHQLRIKNLYMIEHDIHVEDIKMDDGY